MKVKFWLILDKWKGEKILSILIQDVICICRKSKTIYRWIFRLGNRYYKYIIRIIKSLAKLMDLKSIYKSQIYFYIPVKTIGKERYYPLWKIPAT